MGNTTESGELNKGVEVTYQIILPILVVAGIVGSVVSILVLIQSNLKKAIGNRYFLALSCCDLCLSISYIIIAVTACGCDFEWYSSAWFFAHFGWSVTCTFHALGTYIVIFMSLDRFVGVWFPPTYKILTQPPYDITKRLVFAVVLCFGLHVPYMVDAEVLCVDPSVNKTMTYVVHAKDNCTSDIYNTNDGFQKSFKEPWHEVYRYIYNLLVRWLPCALLIVLNFGLVLAVVIGRVKLPRSRDEVKAKVSKLESRAKRQLKINKQEKVLVATAIAMTASYVVMTMPITIFLTGYAKSNDNRCTESSPAETLRHVGNIAQILEHVLHGVYLLLINPSFRQELLCLLQCKKSPDDGHSSVDHSLSNGNRPLSRSFRSIKACRDSIAHGPVVADTVAKETSEELKSLGRDSLKETSEASQPLCCTNSEEGSEKDKYKSFCSDNVEETNPFYI
ncbi:uncharacterized protein LOC126981726 [Eriocheir sinensis]|uniref:uncharacterized protein LOC126981726 n=1 Tax=Eriocheir sinensis TaxID=95602 RepID=UPI0021C8D1EE|nr:uncharacterized protein LOC126981726 [Eriocheir sinensis]